MPAPVAITSFVWQPASPYGDSFPKTVDMASGRSLMQVLLLLALLLELSQPTAAGVMDNVNDGLKLAGQMFGINTAADVANLVAKAFSKATTTTTTRQKPDLLSVLQQGFQSQRQQQEEYDGQDEQQEDDQYAEEEEEEEQQQAEQTEHENAQESPPVTQQQGTRRQRPNQFSSVQMLTNMMRMIGFDPRKLGALAINAIVMIAQAIGSTIVQATRGSPATGPDALYEPSDHQPRSLAPGSPIDWFLKRPGGHTQRMLRRIMDRQLPEHVVDMIASKESAEGNEAACLKLLMCKSSPIIWGMQKSLRRRLAGEPEEHDEGAYMNADMFFKYLPSLHEYKEHGEGCETRYGQHCPTNITMEQP